MANISTTNTNSIYKYNTTITLAFDEENPIELDNLHVKGIVIDYNYDEQNFPLIYITISIEKDLVNQLIEHQMSGTIIFNLRKFIENGDMPGLEVDYINDKFIYFMPNEASDSDEEDDVTNPESVPDITEIYTLGLISLDHINKSKKQVNTIIKKGTKSSIIYYFLSEHQLLIEPLQYNSVIENLVLPPMSSVSKELRYLNNIEVFYDTPYRFFMDYDVTYLLSSSGTLVKRKGVDITDVIITIKREYNEANLEGMVTDQEIMAYTLTVSPSFANVVDSSISSKGYDKLTASTSEGTKLDATIVEIESDSEIKSKTSNLRMPNNNNSMMNNIEYSNKLNLVSMTISTTKVDASVFTIDKIYTINTDETYGDKYTGQYILISKKETYYPEGESFALNISLTFKKIPS